MSLSLPEVKELLVYLSYFIGCRILRIINDIQLVNLVTDCISLYAIDDNINNYNKINNNKIVTEAECEFGTEFL